MTKIAFWINSLGLGGTEKTAVLLAKHLGVPVDFFTYEDAERSRADEIISNGNRVFYVNRQNPDFSPLGKYRIVHTFRAGNPERPEPGIDFVKASNALFVETNIFGLHDENKLIDKTLYMSEWLMNAVGRQKTNPDRFDFLNNPIELPHSNSKLNIEGLENKVVLGRIGRPDPGIYDDIALRAAALAHNSGLPVHFIAVAPCDHMIKDMRDWDIPHTVIDPTVNPYVISQFYNTIDIHTHARVDGETFGCVIGEASLHSKPTITHWATPRNPRMATFQSQTKLVEDGVTGYVVERSIGAYYSRLSELIQNKELREKMGQAAFDKGMREFHADVVVRKLRDIYGL